MKIICFSTIRSNFDNVHPEEGDSLEENDNLGMTSEDDTTSITFSGDDFLDEIDDLAYTPSPDSDRKRTGQ